ncbi:MAG: hypothetical protein M1305_05930, partial [Candidatus Marsarchaeota archaeon]|nr:hypothetical protein [Candidatus Marsarchaeota archaeon]
MKRAWLVGVVAIASMLAAQFAIVANVRAEPDTFNDPNVQTVWERTNYPVETFVTPRSYMWGPDTLPGSPSTEPYANSPGGQRTVQYFDKSRMEVNNPNGDRSNLFFITNGLLVREMVSGDRQFGDDTFRFSLAAQEAVAGDPAPVNPNAPTYATFHTIASLNNDNPSFDRTGQAVTEAIDKAGNISNILSPDPSVLHASFNPNLRHNIPNKFVDFLNQTGPVLVDGQILQEQVIDPTFVAGFPITEAYWTTVLVRGVPTAVLVQLFERRVLTYTPSNPAAFQAEAGNVGRHYFRWRYQTPSAEADIDAAVQTLLNYYRAINDRQYQQAYYFWSGNGQASNQTLDEFTQGFSNTVLVTVQLGMPVEQGASERSVTVPIALASVVNRSATEQVVKRYQGTYTFQPGASAASGSTGWVITSASIAEVAGTPEPPADVADPVALLESYYE